MLKSILLVEDDASIRELYAEILSNEGYVVDQAQNGRVGLEKLIAMRDPPLVLLDMMMPEMNGAEFLAVLHESGRLAAVPVVLISAAAVSSVLLGKARCFIKKPTTIEALLRVVEEYCGPSPLSAT